MKSRLEIFFIMIVTCSLIYCLQSCDATGFSSSGSKGEVSNDNDQEELDNQGDDEMGENLEPQPSNTPLTEEQKQKEMKYILENPKAQDGKPVKVCIAFIRSMAGHSCDKAIYDVKFNDETASSTLNLNNGSNRIVTLRSGELLEIRGGRSDNDLKYFTEADRKVIQAHSNLDVPGQFYESTWKDGKLKVTVSCALSSCHNGIAAISMIGEVKISDGSKKYLRSELALLNTTGSVSVKEYEFAKHELVDDMYEFDDYCGFKTSK